MHLQGQTNIVGIINILLNSPTQTKNVQPPQTDLVNYQQTTKSPWLHCCHSKVSSSYDTCDLFNISKALQIQEL